MAKSRRFAAALAGTREARGFSSAHAFFKLRDGRRAFKMTFRNYLNIEQGQSLPKADRLASIIAALGLEEHSPQAQDLARVYLEELGLGAIARMSGARSAPDDDEDRLTLGELAASKALQPLISHLTREQTALRVSDFEAFACDALLQNTAGGLELSELARLTRFSPAAVKRALAALVAAGLAKMKGSRVIGTLVGRSVAAPPVLPETVRLHAQARRNHQRLAERGKVVHYSNWRLRMTQSNMKKVRRRLLELEMIPQLYENTENTPDSSLYMLQTQIVEVFPNAKSKEV